MHRFKSKRVLALAGALAVVGGGGAALAAGSTSPSGNGFLAAVASHLGISTAKLQDATKAAALDQVNADLKAGRITKAQADELKARIDAGEVPFFGGPGRFGEPGLGFRHFGGPGEDLSAAASYLGLTVPKLLNTLSGGKSLAQVAKDANKPVDGLKQAMLDAATKRLDQAVSDGMMTRAQADEELTELKSRIDDTLNSTFPKPGSMREFRFRQGAPPLWRPAA